MKQFYRKYHYITLHGKQDETIQLQRNKYKNKQLYYYNGMVCDDDDMPEIAVESDTHLLEWNTIQVLHSASHTF